MIPKRVGPTLVLAAAVLCGLSALASPVGAADVFALGTGNGNAGATGVTVPLTAQHNQPMQGFSIAVSFDSSKVTAAGIDFTGTEVELVAVGGTPDYAEFTIDNVAGTMVAGVIFGFSPVPPLDQIPQIPASPDTPNVIAYLIFDIDESTLPTSVPIEFENGVGDPPVNNVYSNDGQSITPVLLDGAISVNNLHRFYFDPMQALINGSISATVRYDHEDPMSGFVISISYDSGKLTLNAPLTPSGWWNGTSLGAALGSETIEYFDVRTTPAVPQPGVGYLALIAQFDFLPPFNGQTLGVGSGQSLVRLPFTVANNPGLIGQSTTIHFENTISPAPPPGNPTPPPTENLVVTGSAQGIFPVQEDGIIEIVDLPGFIRGNPNGDSAVNVADAIFIIQYLFTMGPAPGCADAADVNDDSGIDISDAIYIIGYLFTDGPPPASPFPGCGLDGTADTYDCQQIPTSCQ